MCYESSRKWISAVIAVLVENLRCHKMYSVELMHSCAVRTRRTKAPHWHSTARSKGRAVLKKALMGHLLLIWSWTLNTYMLSRKVRGCTQYIVLRSRTIPVIYYIRQTLFFTPAAFPWMCVIHTAPSPCMGNHIGHSSSKKYKFLKQKSTSIQ